MRSLLFCLAGLIILGFSIQSWPQTVSDSPKSQYLTITRNGNVRSGPGITYDKISTVTGGDKVKRLEQQGEWIKIQLSETQNGWIHQILIRVDDPNNQGKRQLLIREKSLGPVVSASPFRFRIDAKISPDFRRIALNGSEGRSSYLIIDGVKSDLYENLYDGEFSPDSKHFVYRAFRNGNWFVVYDGIEGKTYEDISTPIFSADAKQLSYFAKVDNKWTLVRDGEEKEAFESESSPVLSPDLQRIAYIRDTYGKKSVVIDGIQSDIYDAVSNIIFSPNSQRYAFRAKRGEKFLVVIDGNEGIEYDNISELAFSQNSERVVYLAHERVTVYEELIAIKSNIPTIERRPVSRIRYMCVVDSNVSKAYDEISNITFSPDSKRLAFFASLSEKKVKQTPTIISGIIKAEPPTTRESWYIVIDQQESQAYDHVSAGSIVFSPNSQRIAFTARKGGEWCVIIDGQESACYEDTGNESFRFSPDSRRYAYIAWRNDTRFIVTDGVEGDSYEQVGNPVFSPNSHHIAYVAVQNDRQRIVLDNKAYKEYLGVGFPTFSPDSKKLAYYAAETEDKQFIVVDATEGAKHYHGWFPGAQIMFDNSNRLHFLALRDQEVFLVNVNIQ